MKSNIGILLRKEFLSFIQGAKKTSLKKTKDGQMTEKQTVAKGRLPIVFVIILLALCFGVIFFALANVLCPGLVKLNLEWLYFSLSAIIAAAVGLFGSIFTTYAAIYNAKDNEMLLALPIKPFEILISRLLATYLSTVCFSGVVIIPAFISSFNYIKPNATMIAANIVMIFVIPMFSLSVACLIGWLIGLIASKLSSKVKTAISTLFYLIPLLFAFFGNSYMQKAVQALIANAGKISDSFRAKIYPLYILGEGMYENPLYAVISVLAILLIFAIVCVILSKTFISILTTHKGEKKAVYHEKKAVSHSQGSALFRKELNRYFSCPAYIVNSSLGSLFFLVGGIILLVKSSSILSAVKDAPLDEIQPVLALVICGVLGLISGMNTITAPSISLEGKNLWLMKSLPVDGRKWLGGKLKLHLVMTLIPELFAVVCAEIVFKLSVPYLLLVIVFVSSYTFFNAIVGLKMNLHFHRFDWITETQAVKSNIGVMFTMLVDIFLVIGLGALYIVSIVKNWVVIPPLYFLIGLCVLFVLLDLIMYKVTTGNADKKLANL